MTENEKPSRRDVLARAGAAGVVAWSTPVATGLLSQAGAASGRPMAGGSATIVCDGNGGYRVEYGGWNDVPCGIKDCIRLHEESHIADWRARFPNGCKNADGSNKPDGAAVPTGGDGYAAFLKASECTAYTVELTCVTALTPAAEPCITRVANHKADTARQKARYCS